MLSSAAKAYVALAVFALGAWTVFAQLVDDPDHLGTTLLVTLIFAGALAAWVAAQRSVAETDLARPVPDDAPAPVLAPPAPSGLANRPSVWPLVAALGTALVAVGAAAGKGAVIGGTSVLVIAAGGWLAQSWREHPVWTDRLSARVGERAVGPFGYPVLAVLFGAVVAISISRLYLTISESAAVVVSLLVAATMFVLCIVVAMGRNVGPRLTGALAGIAAASVVASGVAGAANGEREIEVHHVAYSKVHVVAKGTQYGGEEQLTRLDIPEGRVRLTFENEDPSGTYHDIGVYSAKSGGTPFVAVLPIDGGKKATSEIDTAKVGLAKGTTYFFRCDFHPAMVGELHVVDAPAGEAEHGAEKGH